MECDAIRLSDHDQEFVEAHSQDLSRKQRELKTIAAFINTAGRSRANKEEFFRRLEELFLEHEVDASLNFVIDERIREVVRGAPMTR